MSSTTTGRTGSYLHVDVFAGHPLLGAAAMLHREYAVEDEKSWILKVAAADVAVRSQRLGNGHFRCTMTRPALGITMVWSRM